MGKKIFKVPAECQNLNRFFWTLKHEACDELKKNGISEEPRKAEFDLLQKICMQKPKGPLALYVTELKKGYRMSKADLLAYDKQIVEQDDSVDGFGMFDDLDQLAQDGNDEFGSFGEL